MTPSTKNPEARELLNQLEALCLGSSRTEQDRLLAYRLLHSLKSWAAMRHHDEMEADCHQLELSIRGEGQLTEVALGQIRQTLPLLQAGLNKSSNPRPAKALDFSNGRMRVLLPGALIVDQKTAGLIRELRSQGREIRIARIWISPDETMPATRILLLQSLLEDQSLIHAEAWLWTEDGPVGPQDIRKLALAATALKDPMALGDLQGRGALYRCIFAPSDASTDPLQRLWIDQVEAIHVSILTPETTIETQLITGSIGKPELLPQDGSVQGLLFLQRQFMPNPRGASIDSFLSFENSWKNQIALIHEFQGIDAGEYLRRLFRQAGELPLALDTGEGMAPTQWRLLVESVRCQDSILRVIGDILVQLIRNSLAHGRQAQSVRQALHKPAAMLIRLAVLVEGETIKLEYSDDGKGIDPDRVLGKLGRSAGEPLKDADLLEIISTPEFSTNDQMANDAGRGMGLNLVDHSVRQILRGSLQLHNRPNKGATFTIRIPRRLFPVSVMIFQGLSQNLAIPTVHYAGSISLAATSVEHHEDAHWYCRIEGRSLIFTGNESISNPSGLAGLTGALLLRGGLVSEVLVVRNLIGYETVFMEFASESVFSRTLQTWVSLYTGDV